MECDGTTRIVSKVDSLGGEQAVYPWYRTGSKEKSDKSVCVPRVGEMDVARSDKGDEREPRAVDQCHIFYERRSFLWCLQCCSEVGEDERHELRREPWEERISGGGCRGSH